MCVSVVKERSFSLYLSTAWLSGLVKNKFDEAEVLYLNPYEARRKEEKDLRAAM